jgi:hypothetical protein
MKPRTPIKSATNSRLVSFDSPADRLRLVESECVSIEIGVTKPGHLRKEALGPLHRGIASLACRPWSTKRGMIPEILGTSDDRFIQFSV